MKKIDVSFDIAFCIVFHANTVSAPERTLTPTPPLHHVFVPALDAGSDVGLAVLQYRILLPCLPAWKLSQTKVIEVERYHSFFLVYITYIKSLHFCVDKRTVVPNGEQLNL